jgi:hypothetical protein
MAETQYNPVETILLENADDPAALFIFPTDIAASHWADRLLVLRKGGTVALDRFTAWDIFKRESIRARQQDKKSIPSVLRKIFVSCLLEENRDLCKAGRKPLFSSLIPPQYALSGASFVSWFTDILPQLGSWLEKTREISAADSTGPDAEDADLHTLTARYKQFLDDHGLFEPAWEKPPFEDAGKRCFIFFPECLADYGEYEALLENSEHITPVRLRDTGAAEKPFETRFYTNSRSEIIEAALYIRGLHEKEGVPFESIVVSLPDTENYEPYVIREFENRNIPLVRRAGKPLASYPAGRLFDAAANCVSHGFSFDSLINLLLNSHLPWKDPQSISQLADFGIKNNCISSWKEMDGTAIDVWEDAFGALAGSREERAHLFYRDMKAAVKKLCGASSFADILKRYFVFRDTLLDMKRCLPETDLVLSRCVSELLSLIEIEKLFPDIKAPDPYACFTEHLQEKTYLAQQSSSGVTILPYRTAAPVPFECHIVIGSSQDTLSAVFSPFMFLLSPKRDRLGIGDTDVSEIFIDLHRLNSLRPAVFFCAEETFSGYAIPHSRLKVSGKPRLRWGSGAEAGQDTGTLEADPFWAEQEWYRSLQTEEGSDAAFPRRLHGIQAAGFRAWRNRRQEPALKTRDDPADAPMEHPMEFFAMTAGDSLLRDIIRKRFRSNPDFPDQLSVSASSMKPYYQCALQWLFQRALSLEDVRMETTLMAENVLGSLYHAVIDRFLKKAEQEAGGVLLPLDKGVLPGSYRSLLAESAAEIFDGLPLLPGERIPMSALTLRLLRAEQGGIREQLEVFFTAFLKYFAGCRIAGSELGYAYAEPGSPFFMTGKVDCMLEDLRDNRDEQWIIVDFKLGNTPNRKGCIAGGESGLEDFQLPMYLTLAEKNGGKSVYTALFFSILKTEPLVVFGSITNAVTGKTKPYGKDNIIERDGPGDDRYCAIMAEFLQKAEQYAAEVNAGRFSTLSGGEKKCYPCKYHGVCRTVYAVDRDRNLLKTGAGDGP